MMKSSKKVTDLSSSGKQVSTP